MKRGLLLIILLTAHLISSAQLFNAERTSFALYLSRMYRNAPYDVKLVEDQNQAYLISAVALDPHKYDNILNMARVANTKALVQANKYFNGSTIIPEEMITTISEKDGEISKTPISKIQEYIQGGIRQMEEIDNFAMFDSVHVYIYAVPIP